MHLYRNGIWNNIHCQPLHGSHTSSHCKGSMFDTKKVITSINVCVLRMLTSMKHFYGNYFVYKTYSMHQQKWCNFTTPPNLCHKWSSARPKQRYVYEKLACWHRLSAHAPRRPHLERPSEALTTTTHRRRGRRWEGMASKTARTRLLNTSVCF